MAAKSPRRPAARAQPDAPPVPAGPFAAEAASAMLAAMNVMEASLVSWRGVMDSARSTMRDQQDALFDAWRAHLTAIAERQAHAAALMFPLGWLAPRTAGQENGEAEELEKSR